MTIWQKESRSGVRGRAGEACGSVVAVWSMTDRTLTAVHVPLAMAMAIMAVSVWLPLRARSRR